MGRSMSWGRMPDETLFSIKFASSEFSLSKGVFEMSELRGTKRIRLLFFEPNLFFFWGIHYN